MKTILVTGGAGFIGGCFARQWVLEEAGRIVNVDRLTYAGNLEGLANIASHPRHLFVHGDIADRQLITGLLESYRVEAVLNFAAQTHVDRSIDGPAPFISTNVVGTFELLEAVRGYWSALPPAGRSSFRFLHVSTDEVYGSLGGEGLFTEQSRYAPNSPYAATKAASDHLVRAYHVTYGLPTLTTNCANNYGPFQFPEKLIPLVILNCLDGRPVPVYGDGLQVREWLHVEDHCRAIRAVLSRGRPGEVYHVGGLCERTNLQVVTMLCEAVDRLYPELPHRPCASLVRHVEDRPGHDRRYALDGGKIRTELGWQPRIDFDAGVVATVQWYGENREWVERIESREYQRQRLGLGPDED